MNKSIIIIGAGIAGLSAGCYGQMNGYQTQIFELHTQPGGLCTAWKRKDYTFDGCIHWLVGSKPGSGLNKIWAELGALQDKTVVNHEQFWRIEGPDGKALTIYTNVDRLEKHMKELAPADSKVIEEFCNAIRKLTRFPDSPPDGPRNLADRMKGILRLVSMAPALAVFGKYRNVTTKNFADRFTDPFMRQALTDLFGPDFALVALLMTLAWMHNQNAGYPIGGSLPFSQAVEKRYLALGGEIHYKSRVEKILVENGRAVGVRLTDCSEHRADVVISAADGHATIFDMLENKYADDEIRGYYETMPIFEPLVLVSLGVARDLSQTPHAVTWKLDQPISIAGEARPSMNMKHYCYDPTLAPAGKSVVEAMFSSNHKYWKELAGDSERYEAEKKQIAITVMEQLDKRIPGLAGQVEVVDVATPLTFERYTGNWQGSFEGWQMTAETMKLTMSGKGLRKTLPGLENFYMIGQWVEPGGGLPTGAMSARRMIKTLCEKDKRPFVTNLP
ncbi:MAG: NAD(P)/FAD-dependent oxidoreductase [Anaerolineales bacterium]